MTERTEEISVRASKVQWLLFMIAMMSFIVAFTGIKAQDISSVISSVFFPKVDYLTIQSGATPTSLPADFELSLRFSSVLGDNFSQFAVRKSISR